MGHIIKYKDTIDAQEIKYINLISFLSLNLYHTVKLEGPLKTKAKNWFCRQIIANEGQRNCRMLQWEHSAILLIFIQLQFVIKIIVLSILNGHL